MVRSIKKLLSRTPLVVAVAFSLVLAGSLTLYFYYRVQQIDSLCTRAILEEFQTEAWGAGKPLTPLQQLELQQVKLLYLYQKHHSCIEAHKLFYLF